MVPGTLKLTASFAPENGNPFPFGLKGLFLGRVYLPIHEWLIFMVN